MLTSLFHVLHFPPAGHVIRAIGLMVLIALSGLFATPASAATYIITAAGRFVYLQIGSPGTLDTVTATVTPSTVIGTPVVMTSSSGTTGRGVAGAIVCTMPNQILLVAEHGRTSGPTTVTASLSVRSNTTTLGSTNGTSIPFTEISWTSSQPEIGPGAFNGSATDQILATIGTDIGVETCLTYSFANTAVRMGGTYTGQATFTLFLP